MCLGEGQCTCSTTSCEALPLDHPLAPDRRARAQRRRRPRRCPCLVINAGGGGARYAGLLTGVAVTCASSGILVGPALFGAALETLGSYRWSWLALTGSGAAVAVVLARTAPRAKRA